MNNFPSVLTIHLKRASWDESSRIKQTAVQLPLSLDMAFYSMRRSGMEFKYPLNAIVSHYAITNAFGHYAAHLIDNSIVKAYDDELVETRRVSDILDFPSVQKSSHLLFNFLKPNRSHIESRTVEHRKVLVWSLGAPKHARSMSSTFVRFATARL